MSEPTQNQNQSETPIQNQVQIETAPYLCWGQSDIELDASFAKACQYRVYFKRIVEIASFEEDEPGTKRIVTIYYYDTPITSTKPLKKVPKKGIVVETIEKYRNEYGQTVQVSVTLEFLPIKLRLF